MPACISYVLSRVLVPMQYQATVGTGVRSHRESFGHILAAARTVLAGVFRTDLHDGFDGAFSLVLQNQKELSPSGISDSFCQVVVREHPFDVEVLDIERIKLTHERMSELVLKVQSGSLNALMRLREQDFRFFSSLA